MVFVGSYGFNPSTRLSWISGIGDDDPIAMSEYGSLSCASFIDWICFITIILLM